MGNAGDDEQTTKEPLRSRIAVASCMILVSLGAGCPNAADGINDAKTAVRKRFVFFHDGRSSFWKKP
jgi:hypothetical protein